MFYIFIKACKKYAFTYALSTCGGLTLILRPYDTFENINIEEKFCDYNKVFIKAIKEMKKYREKRGY